MRCAIALYLCACASSAARGELLGTLPPNIYEQSEAYEAMLGVPRVYPFEIYHPALLSFTYQASVYGTPPLEWSGPFRADIEVFVGRLGGDETHQSWWTYLGSPLTGDTGPTTHTAGPLTASLVVTPGGYELLTILATQGTNANGWGEASFSLTDWTLTPIPEPSTLVLLIVGALAGLVAWRRSA